MATIKLKRSDVPGKAPLPEDLELGELAVNTADGVLYLKTIGGEVREADDPLRTDLANPNMGAGMVGYRGRSVHDKLGEVKSLLDMGAAGDGVQDDTVALQDANMEPFIYVTPGKYRISQDVLVVKEMHISPGAEFHIDAGVTLEINARINGPIERVFFGSGNVLMGSLSRIDVRTEWWGARADDPTVDSSVAFNKLSDSFGTYTTGTLGTEVTVLLSAGTYYVANTTTWPRATRVVSAGERISHIRCVPQFINGDVFTTKEEGCTFEGIQFSAAASRHSGAFVNLQHNYCRAKNLWMTDGYGGVVVNGNSCDVDLIFAFTGNWSASPGSYIVKNPQGSGGFNSRFGSVSCIGDGGPPKAWHCALIEGGALFHIDKIASSGAKFAVSIAPTSGSARRGVIGTVQASAGESAVVVTNPVTGSVQDIRIDNVIASNLTGVSIALRKISSGGFRYIDVGSLIADECGGGLAVSSESGLVELFTLASANIHNCTGDGINIDKANSWTVTKANCISNGGTGTVIGQASGFIYTLNKNLYNGVAQLSDSSGAVTKVVENNL